MIVDQLVFSLFFFSSRRRHTRLQGDWSSDVCSSDLIRIRKSLTGLVHRGIQAVIEIYEGALRPQARSEERRVGKECRCRGTAKGGKENGESRKMSAEEIEIRRWDRKCSTGRQGGSRK